MVINFKRYWLRMAMGDLNEWSRCGWVGLPPLVPLVHLRERRGGSCGAAVSVLVLGICSVVVFPLQAEVAWRGWRVAPSWRW